MRLYISNLSHYVTELELRGLFRTFGTVDSVSVVLDKKTGSSRGFGFVTMLNPLEAELAMKKLNQWNFYGNEIGVFEAFENKKYKRPKDKDIDLSPRIHRDTKTTFFVILSKEISEDELFQVVSKFLKKEKITQAVTLGEYPERPKDLDPSLYMIIVSVIGNNVALMISEYLDSLKINGHKLITLSR